MPNTYRTEWNQNRNTADCYVNGELVTHEVFVAAQQAEAREKILAETMENRMSLREYPINTNVMVTPGTGVPYFGTVVGYQLNTHGEVCLRIQQIVSSSAVQFSLLHPRNGFTIEKV